MAVVILGGLATSTLLNLFVVPTLYLKFGKQRERNSVSGQLAGAGD
jgi:Cu/Ag efflux pump CusA